ncbi:MAG: hypothetical protein ACJAT2_001234 [Bacteriovoracaceae bacterium]|jgi:hypothetical protein
MINSFDFSKSPEFLKIQDLIFDKLKTHFNTDWEGVLTQVKAGNNVDLREDRDLMLKIENIFSVLLKDYFSEMKLQTLQFPVNLRIVTANLPDNYLKRPFATDYVHCEAWSGVPIDSHNFFLYIYLDEDSPTMKLFELEEVSEDIVKYRGPYSNSPLSKAAITEVQMSHTAGMMYVFSPYVPHETIREGSGVRISIDFKARTGIPYELETGPISKEDFCSYKPGFPGLGMYWFRSNSQLEGLEEKYEFEMNKALRLDPSYLSLRKEYIKNLKEKSIFK